MSSRGTALVLFIYVLACSAGPEVNADTVINNTTNITVNNRITPSRVVIVRNASLPSAPSTTPPPSSFPYEPNELIPYLPPHCAQLYESQLYPRQRHESFAVANSVRNEFSHQCGDALSDARQALYKDQLKKYYAKQDQRMAVANATALSSKMQEQCNELLRILAEKRKRLNTMSEGERADHARSEEVYVARCKGNSAH